MEPTTGKSIAMKLIFLPGFILYLLSAASAEAQSFLYYPRVFTRVQVDQMARYKGLERWTNASGENIGFMRMALRKPPSVGSVLIMYGNGNTALGCVHYAGDIQTVAALDAYILEYPGYEDRPGQPSQASLFAAADDAFQMLPTNKPIYLVGESLGSGVASYLAGTHTNRITGMVLISPFNRILDVATNDFPNLDVQMLLTDQYPSEDYLRHYHGKVGITVDGRDTVVPEKFGLRLYDSYDGPKKLWEFPTGAHTQITGPPTDFWRQTVQFWQTN